MEKKKETPSLKKQQSTSSSSPSSPPPSPSFTLTTLLTNILSKPVHGQNDATHFLTTLVHAGVPIRRALDETRSRHGLSAWDTPPAQHALLQTVLLLDVRIQPHFPTFTLGTTRRKRFARLLCDEIDHCRADIDEQFAMHVATLSNTSHTDQLRPIHWLILRIAHSKYIAVCVADALSNLGMQVWQAGLALYAHLLQPMTKLRADICGNNVLEIGAGTALSATALLHAGVKTAYLTDIPKVLPNLRKNITANTSFANTPTSVIQTAHLDITAQPPGEHAAHLADEWCIDTVLAADLTYDVDLILHLIPVISVILLAGGGNRVAYLFATKRSDVTHETLMEQLANRPWLRVETLHLSSSTSDTNPFNYMVHCDWSAVFALRLTCNLPI